jgi:type IV pilus assembly protein PilC
MAKFNYVLSDQNGLKETGIISASNKQAVLEQLTKTGKIIISITEEKKRGLAVFNKPSFNMQAKLLFVKNLSMMLSVGLTVTEALEIIESQERDPNKRRMYKEMIEMIKAGQSLGNSLKKYQYLFSNLFVNMIKTGEENGNLEETLQYLDQQMEKAYHTRKKVIGTMIYPAVLLTITILISVGIVVFIMPKIMGLFSSLGSDLPLPTKILVKVSNFFTEQTGLALLSIVGFFGGFYSLLKWKRLKPFWHRLFINLPIFGKLFITANVARFARTLSSLLKSGVTITEALNTCSDTLDNNLYKKALLESANKVEKGAGLGETLEIHPKLFPILSVKLMYIGEKTGSLETTSGKIAEMYEKLVDEMTKSLSTIMEPIMLVFMGGMVGGIAMSIILPIYKVTQMMQ